MPNPSQHRFLSNCCACHFCKSKFFFDYINAQPLSTRTALFFLHFGSEQGLGSLSHFEKLNDMVILDDTIVWNVFSFQYARHYALFHCVFFAFWHFDSSKTCPKSCFSYGKFFSPLFFFQSSPVTVYVWAAFHSQWHIINLRTIQRRCL